MPIDPEIQVWLNAYKNLPSIASLSPKEAKQLYELTVKNELEIAPVEITSQQLVDPPLTLRIYKPPTMSILPILVYFHGGGWVLGNLEAFEGVCSHLSYAGECIVVSVDYRLAPDYPFPIPVEDAYGATLWVSQQAEVLGGSRDRVAVGGDSAGGNLAAAVALMNRDRATFPLCHQFLIYPVTDARCTLPSYTTYATDYGLTQAEMRWFWQQYLLHPEQGQKPYASPLLAEDLTQLPPATIFTAEYDVLRSDGEMYAQKLQGAGVPVHLEELPGMIHGCLTLPTLPHIGQRILKQMSPLLSRALQERLPPQH